MTNYITEKAHWQALISIKEEGPLQLLNFLLKLRCISKSIFISQSALARRFGVCIRTIGRWIKVLRDYYLIKLNHRWLQTSICIINSYILKYSEKYKQIFPALRHFTENALDGIFGQNVRHIYNDNINIKEDNKNKAQNSSVFFSSNNLLIADGGQDIAPSFAELKLFNNIAIFGQDMDYKQIPINKLTDEEWEEIDKPKTKQQIRQQKEELTKKMTTIVVERSVKHLGKSEAHPYFAQYKFSDDR
jgi:hypothetical protein